MKTIRTLFSREYLHTGIIWAVSGFAIILHLSAKPVQSHSEAINTLDDLTEWIEWDIAEGRTDSVVGYSYLENIEAVRTELTKQ